MEGPKVVAAHAVGGYEQSTRAQDSRQLGEHAVLAVVGRNVVQHVERDRAGEPAGRKIQRGCITEDHVDVRSVEPPSQRAGQVGIQLYGSELIDAGAQDVRGEPRTGTNFDDVTPEVRVAERGGEDDLLDPRPPLRARAELQMGLVHVTTIRENPATSG